MITVWFDLIMAVLIGVLDALWHADHFIDTLPPGIEHGPQPGPPRTHRTLGPGSLKREHRGCAEDLRVMKYHVHHSIRIAAIESFKR